jgi:hypothetical protein
VAEDPAHDGGPGGVDRAQAALALAIGPVPDVGPVALGGRGDVTALEDAAGLAAARLVGEVLQVEGAHRALQADIQFLRSGLRPG